MAQVDTQTLLGRIGKMTAYENLRTLEKNITAWRAIRQLPDEIPVVGAPRSPRGAPHHVA